MLLVDPLLLRPLLLLVIQGFNVRVTSMPPSSAKGFKVSVTGSPFLLLVTRGLVSRPLCY
jgi:hypothetical protein